MRDECGLRVVSGNWTHKDDVVTVPFIPMGADDAIDG